MYWKGRARNSGGGGFKGGGAPRSTVWTPQAPVPEATAALQPGVMAVDCCMALILKM